jgi:hypothetical protein
MGWQYASTREIAVLLGPALLDVEIKQPPRHDNDGEGDGGDGHNAGS